MGSENHEVVDISSDEEVEVFDRDYSSWLNKDDSDSSTDVVVEVKARVRSQLNSSTRAALQDDDDDDDCVILDCDPDKTTSAVESEADDDDDDEVLVLGQKGEIACRDFPHPRHSCAKYSFNSTSHESYCDMCHCYVCDIPAPCPYWCVAVSSIDHCHANDKDKAWMNKRHYFRTGGKMPTVLPPPPPPGPPPAHATTVSPAQRSIIRLSQNPRNKIEIRPCSSSASATRVTANLSNARGRRSVLRQSLSSIQKNRSTYMGNSRPRVASLGTRSYGNNVKVGLYTNAKVSLSVAPTISPQVYTQQQQQERNSQQLNVTDYGCAAVTTGSQSNADLFTLPEWGSTVQQQPGTNENVLQTKLSEVESWLMDSCNQASPLPEPIVGQDNVTFDFETLLND